MKKKILITIISIMVLLLTSCNNFKYHNFKSIDEFVIDLGVYNIYDWAYCTNHYYDYIVNNKMACSAIYKKINDENIVARNMDITLSNNPILIYRSNNEKFKTINIAHSAFTNYSYQEMINNGIDKDYLKVIPSFTTDSLNEKGLYISINMRECEYDDFGNLKWMVSHTNNDSPIKILSSAIPLYLTQRCENIAEVLEELNKFDIVNYIDDYGWNFGYTIVDSTGRHGVLEIVDNKAIYNEDISVNTNTYIFEEYRNNAQYLTGLGREEYLKSSLGDVTDVSGMLSLISDVTAGRIYTKPFECKFDIRNDYLDAEIGWTSSFVTDEKNQDIVLKEIIDYSSYMSSLSFTEKINTNDYWMSIYTLLVNTNKKTIFIRFFEDDNKTTELSFD